MARHQQHPASRHGLSGAFGVAIALHVGLMWGAWMIADDNLLIERLRVSLEGDQELVLIEIEEAPANSGESPPEDDPPPAREPPSAREPPAPGAVAAPANDQRLAARETSPAPLEPGPTPEAQPGPEVDLGPFAPPGPEVAPPEWPPADEGYGTSHAALPGLPGSGWGLGALALGGPDVAPRAAPTRAPAAPDVDPNIAGQVLSSTLHTRDRELGLEMPAAGVVSSAVSVAVRSLPVPDDTRATFEVRLAPDGRVEHARVVSSTKGDAAMWDGAAKSTAAALSAKKLTMTGEAQKRGATVVVEVQAQRVYPANSKKQVDVKPVCADRIVRDMVEVLDDGRGDPAGAAKAPAGLMEEDSKFCIPIGVAGVGDASNLGAHLQTVVRTKHKVVIDGMVDLPTEVHAVNTDAPWVKRDQKGERPTLPPKWRKKKQEWEKKNQGKKSGPAAVKPLSPHD